MPEERLSTSVGSEEDARLCSAVPGLAILCHLLKLMSRLKLESRLIDAEIRRRAEVGAESPKPAGEAGFGVRRRLGGGAAWHGRRAVSRSHEETLSQAVLPLPRV